MTTQAELDAMTAWRNAYERTDLVARLGFATLADYRSHGLELPGPIVTQLDRFEQAVAYEQAAHDRYEQAREAKP